MWTLAQTGQWWETVPAQIVLWGTAVIILLSVLKRLFGGAEFTRRLFLAFLSLGETKQWPNGSTDLPSSLNEIYRRQDETYQLLSELRDDFRSHALDHDLHRIER